MRCDLLSVCFTGYKFHFSCFHPFFAVPSWWVLFCVLGYSSVFFFLLLFATPGPSWCEQTLRTKKAAKKATNEREKNGDQNLSNNFCNNADEKQRTQKLVPQKSVMECNKPSAHCPSALSLHEKWFLKFHSGCGRKVKEKKWKRTKKKKSARAKYDIDKVP